MHHARDHSSLRRLTGWNAAIRFRRTPGSVRVLLRVSASADLYRCRYWLASLGFPSLLVWQNIRELGASIGGEIYKRPYITVGFTSWVFAALAAHASTSGMKRRMGGKRWQALHRLIYPAAIAGVIHYWWLVKADVTDPRFYAGVVGVLLVFRIWWWCVIAVR